MAIRRQFKKTLFLVTTTLCLCALHSSVTAQSDEDKKILMMYFKSDELVVEAPTRSAKPLSRVAENVSVITARDIERMNAHTVADALNTVTGVQVLLTSGPGSPATAYVQGSDTRHVTVLVDGVVLNNLSDNVVDLGLLPVQNIEKIEIIKGPASSAWGSALGGVINIITKTGRPLDGADVFAAASYGERNTGDFRAEARGRRGAFGYYLDAGRLQADGLTPHTKVSNNNAFMSLNYAVSDKTDLALTSGFTDASRDVGEFSFLDAAFGDELRHQQTTLSLKTAATDHTEVQVSLWSSRQRHILDSTQISTGNELSRDHYLERGFGSSVEVVYRGMVHHLVIGLDLDERRWQSNIISDKERSLRKAAVYLNDTLSFDTLSVTPGIRFDYTSSNGNITSPSIGVTYQATRATIFRASAARGFSIPTLAATYGTTQLYTANPDLRMERVQSYQAGAETGAINYIWCRVSVFRHEVRDAIFNKFTPPSSFQAVNESRQRRQGVEAELKTAPVLNLSLTAGAAVVAIKDLNTGNSVEDIPVRTYDAGIVYDDEDSFRAQLKGRYIDWHSNPTAQGNYKNFIFDLNASNTFYRTAAGSLEAFATVHNIFNDSQYAIIFYRNPDRWIEGGLRYRF